MSKSILVINTPKSCRKCRIFNDKDYTCCGCKVQFKDIDKVQDWCPLKPMLTKKVPVFDPNDCDIEKEKQIIHEIDGYNRAIDELLGEKEEECYE